MKFTYRHSALRDNRGGRRGISRAGGRFGENVMSKDPKAPKKAQSGPAKKPQPRRADELSKEDLDKATGGLVPAVSPEK